MVFLKYYHGDKLLLIMEKQAAMATVLTKNVRRFLAVRTLSKLKREKAQREAEERARRQREEAERRAQERIRKEREAAEQAAREAEEAERRAAEARAATLKREHVRRAQEKAEVCALVCLFVLFVCCVCMRHSHTRTHTQGHKHRATHTKP